MDTKKRGKTKNAKKKKINKFKTTIVGWRMTNESFNPKTVFYQVNSMNQMLISTTGRY